MKSVLILALLCYFTCARSAPLRGDDVMTAAAGRGASLAKKILRDVPGVHEACVTAAGLTLEVSGEAEDLQYLQKELSIPAAPVLKAVADEHTLAVSLSRMVEGLDLHQDLLQEIGGHLTSSEELKVLLSDIKELTVQVHEIQKLAQIPITVSQSITPDFSSRLSSDYKVQVAAHLSLLQLRRFTQDVFRSLRHIAVYH